MCGYLWCPQPPQHGVHTASDSFCHWLPWVPRGQNPHQMSVPLAAKEAGKAGLWHFSICNGTDFLSPPSYMKWARAYKDAEWPKRSLYMNASVLSHFSHV